MKGKKSLKDMKWYHYISNKILRLISLSLFITTFVNIHAAIAIPKCEKSILPGGCVRLDYQKAILAGGCFWGVQDLFNSLDGVVESKAGYIGGDIPNPTYEIISSGLSNHAESIEVTFNPQKISYEEVLKFFFTIHDPTTLNQQQNDIGSQYRSEIFYLNSEQRDIAKKVILQANQSGVFNKSVVTKISKAGKFYLAEEYHQDYLKKNPYGYTCHHVREEWKF